MSSSAQQQQPRRSIEELQRLEEEAWASPRLRRLYATRYIPGFPWHTVQEEPTPFPSSSSPAALSSSPSPHAQNGDALVSPISLSVSSSPAARVRRHVIPYNYAFKVFVKGRWVGRKLLEVYAAELPHHTPAYYEACLRTGRLSCVRRGALGQHNTKRGVLKRSAADTPHPKPPAPHPTRRTTVKDEQRNVPAGNTGSPPSRQQPLRHSAAPLPPFDPLLETMNITLQHGDVIHHTVHRHEIPVSVGTTGADPLYITAVCIQRYGLICVLKPTGLPTHATGRYFYNSVTSILEYVLAPKRLEAWLLEEDPLLQSLASTDHLSAREKAELYEHYRTTGLRRSSDDERHAGCVGHTSALTGDDSGAPEDCALLSNGSQRPRPTRNSAGEFAREDAEGCHDSQWEGGAGENEEVDPEKIPRPCHRLDKVTSGVLLLAVNREAANRIGAVLMRKAKEVEELVSQRLCGAAVSGGPVISSDNTARQTSEDSTALPSCLPLPAPLQHVVAQPSELQKYYLARVHVKAASRKEQGERRTIAASLEAAAALAQPRVWSFSGAEPYLQAHNLRLQGLLEPLCSAGAAPTEVFKSTGGSPCSLVPAYPGGVLTAMPLLVPGSSALRATRETAAATLCQSLGVFTRPPLPVAPRSTEVWQRFPGAPLTQTRVEEEALMLCTPYTGRLHQIRSHLSSLGCPIVGDVTYGPPKVAVAARHDGSEDTSTLAALGSFTTAEGSTASEAVEASPTDQVPGSWRCDDASNYVFFDSAQLPAAYRNFITATLERIGTMKSGDSVTPCAPTSLSNPDYDEVSLAVATSTVAVATPPNAEECERTGVKRTRCAATSSTLRSRQGVAPLGRAMLHTVAGNPTTDAPTDVVYSDKEKAMETQGVEFDVPRWRLEPLCYECAGRLPIVAAMECATGTASICLHAWAYEVKEDLLLGSTDLTAPEKVTTPAAAAAVPSPLRSTTPDERSPRVGSDAALLQTGSSARLTENLREGFVRFKAPPPTWAWEVL